MCKLAGSCTAPLCSPVRLGHGQEHAEGTRCKGHTTKPLLAILQPASRITVATSVQLCVSCLKTVLHTSSHARGYSRLPSRSNKIGPLSYSFSHFALLSAPTSCHMCYCMLHPIRALGLQGLVAIVTAPLFSPSPTSVWQANRKLSGFCGQQGGGPGTRWVRDEIGKLS